MAKLSETSRLRAPLMFAFRKTHKERDARLKPEQRIEHGKRIVESSKGTHQAINERLLRDEVWGDLEDLMNTVALESSEDLRGLDHVRASVLNYGMPDITHRSIDERSVDDVGQEIETILNNFEPRLVPGSLHVTRDKSIDKSTLKIRFLVRADLSCKPLDVPVEFTADVEVDSGNIVVSRP